jgi:hypothetical protein
MVKAKLTQLIFRIFLMSEADSAWDRPIAGGLAGAAGGAWKGGGVGGTKYCGCPCAG